MLSMEGGVDAEVTAIVSMPDLPIGFMFKDVCKKTKIQSIIDPTRIP